MAKRVIHRRLRRVLGWPEPVYEVLCNLAWVSNTTDVDAEVTCKRCLRRMETEKVQTVPDPRAYAISAHGEQRYGNAPYVVHLDHVAEIVGDDKLLRTVAYLHDVLEDTDRSVAEIEAAFGADAARAVMALTDPEGNRRERKAHAVRVLGSLDPAVTWQRAALVVKVADRIANVRCAVGTAPVLLRSQSLLGMYAQEHPEFKAAARRCGLCDEQWAELDQLLGF